MRHSVRGDDRARRRAERQVKLAAGGVLLLLVATWSASLQQQICSECGRERTRSTLDIPFTLTPYWTTSQVKSTPFYESIAESVEPHHHRWATIYGSRFDSGLTGSGSGRRAARNAANDACRTLILATARYCGSDEARQLLRWALSPDDSHKFDMFIRGVEIPGGGWPDSKSFQDWLRGVQHAGWWDECSSLPLPCQ